MKKYVIKLNEKIYEVEIEEVTSETATTMVESEKNTNTSKTVQASAGTTIEAPMPGSIIDVKVKVGDAVKKDQPLVILEAMKMENEIVSPLDGKIVSVGVSKGDTVNPGDVLVQIGK
jgi:glutaconyl-CoA/methylmalonyl-CoA decarboxylase subunit gamma